MSLNLDSLDNIQSDFGAGCYSFIIQNDIERYKYYNYPKIGESTRNIKDRIRSQIIKSKIDDGLLKIIWYSKWDTNGTEKNQDKIIINKIHERYPASKFDRTYGSDYIDRFNCIDIPLYLDYVQEYFRENNKMNLFRRVEEGNDLLRFGDDIHNHTIRYNIEDLIKLNVLKVGDRIRTKKYGEDGYLHRNGYISYFKNGIIAPKKAKSVNQFIKDVVYELDRNNDSHNSVYVIRPIENTQKGINIGTVLYLKIKFLMKHNMINMYTEREKKFVESYNDNLNQITDINEFPKSVIDEDKIDSYLLF